MRHPRAVESKPAAAPASAGPIVHADQLTVNLDQARRVVAFSFRVPLALEPTVVEMPFGDLKTIAAELLLLEVKVEQEIRAKRATRGLVLAGG